MKTIRVRDKKLTHVILVDDEDYDWLIRYKWVWRKGDRREDSYPATKIGNHYESMHRMIMGVMYKEDVIVDHQNGNKRDMRRKNLRRADRFQNQQNRKTNKGNTLPKGVRRLPSGRYNVRIQTYGKRVIVGTFDTLEEALQERNRVAKQLHGEFFNASYMIGDSASI